MISGGDVGERRRPELMNLRVKNARLEGLPVAVSAERAEVVFASSQGFLEQQHRPTSIEGAVGAAVRGVAEALLLAPEVIEGNGDGGASCDAAAMLVDGEALERREQQRAQFAAAGVGLVEELSAEDDVGEEGLGEFGGVVGTATMGAEVGVHRRPVARDEEGQHLVAVVVAAFGEGADVCPLGGSEIGLGVVQVHR